MPVSIFKDFLRLEAAAGLILCVAAVLATVCANSALESVYNGFLSLPLEVRIGPLHLAKPLLLWINDGLMAIFFLLIGLEVKREILEGELSSRAQVVLPAVAALGGVVVPALVYCLVTGGHDDLARGWAIPTATDIAFSLGVLAFFSSRVPTSLTVFLMALAIIDDLAAIIIIALFYTSNLAVMPLFMAAIGLLALVLLNRFRVQLILPYLLIGMALWVCVLKSGVHATLAGVAVAMTIPLRGNGSHSPLRELEHRLHPWVAFGILPLFAFTNAGVDFRGMTLSSLTAALPLAIAVGLFLGKQVGVFGFSWLAIKFGWAQLPTGSNFKQLYGVAVLTGIGFTMSLFIGSLAFVEGGYEPQIRLGVLVGTVLSAIFGAFVLRCGGGALERDGK